MKTMPALPTLPVVAVLVLVPVLTGSLALCQELPGQQGARAVAESATTALPRMEQEMTEATAKGDAAALDRAMVDTCIVTSPDGSVLGKAQFLGALRFRSYKIESSRIEGLRVQVYGDTAIVTYGTTDSGTYNGQHFLSRARWTRTWQSQAGRWKILASHGTAVASPSK